MYNLNYSASKEDLHKMFTTFAKVEEIIMPWDKNGYPQGYAFVYLKKESDVDWVIEYCDQRHILDRQIWVMKNDRKFTSFKKSKS